MTSTPNPLEQRRQTIAAAKRIVVKVGSRLLTGIAGTPERTRIEQLINELSHIRDRGVEVVLVSSGAIAAGMMLTEAEKRPRDLPRLQALAAMGQSRLMSLYETACQQHGFHGAQILLSNEDVKNRRRHLNVRNCIHTLLSGGQLPIINENDAVSVAEIQFGDNDRLAALVGTMIRADLTILLTTADGFYERSGDELTKRISVVDDLTPELRQMAMGTDGNPFSVGGMETKLDAAEIVMDAGECLWIADGQDFGVLGRIMNGEDVGTLFVPSSSHLSGAKRWLAFFADTAGQIEIDEGAVEALQKGGRSLLPSGITAVRGEFQKGDTVHVVSPDGVAIGIGVSNYSTGELIQIKGQRTDRILQILGECLYDEVIHRNNFALL